MGRRTRGSGSVLRGKTGRWIARVTDERTGLRRSVGTFDTKREAERAIAEAIVGGVPSGDGRQAFGAYLEGYLDSHSVGLKATTDANDRMNVRVYVKPYPIARIRLADLLAQDFRDHYAMLSREGRRGGGGLAPSSIARVNRILKAALRQAVEDGLIGRNPVPRLVTRKDEAETPWLTADRCHQLAAYAAARYPDLEVVVRLGAFAGLRRGEICGLRWEDVDLVSGTAHVRRNRTVAAGMVVETTPKTADSAAEVPLDRELVLPALVQLLERQEAEGATGGYVVATSRGEGRDPNNLSRDFRQLFDEFNERRAGGGLPAVSIHGLRHSFLSNLRAAGEDVHTVSKAARHSSIKTTADVYIHGSAPQVRRAVEALRA